MRLHKENNYKCHIYIYKNKLLRGQSKPKAYPMVRKSDNLYVNVILKETLFSC